MTARTSKRGQEAVIDQASLGPSFGHSFRPVDVSSRSGRCVRSKRKLDRVPDVQGRLWTARDRRLVQANVELSDCTILQSPR
jgi:hypothetical protein